MKLRSILASISLALLVCLPAQAKGIFMVNTGDELFTVAAFPERLISQFPALAQVQAGYKCEHFGLFWADVWTWDCKLVGVDAGDSYYDLPEPVVSALATDPQYAMGKAKRGLWNHYGIFAMLAAVGGYLFLRRAL